MEPRLSCASPIRTGAAVPSTLLADLARRLASQAASWVEPPLTAMSFSDAAGKETLRHEAVDDDRQALAWARALHPAGGR